VAAILAMAVLASAALIGWAHPAVVGVALLAGVLASAVPLVRGLPSLPSVPSLTLPKRRPEAIARRIRALEEDPDRR
jgi:hypothetical protein